MSISTGGTRKAGPFSGNGSTTAFPFAFKVFQASDVLVVQTDTTPADTTLVLDTNYTVSLNANQDANPGGTVNMVTAPPSGYLLTIGSDLPQLQSVTLTNNGGFYPTVINNALDYMTILVQQLSEKIGRALVMPFSTNATGQLPPVSPGSLLGWKQDGSGIDNVGATGVGAGGIVASNMAAGATGNALSGDTNAAVTKTTPADTDKLPLFDSADFWYLKGLSWANLRNALFSSLNIPIVQGYSGKVWEGTPGTGARVRRFADSIAATTGNIEIGESYNCDLNPTTGVWAGRDVTDMCWLEKWSDTGGVKEFWYAASAAAGTVPAWQRAFWMDMTTRSGNMLPAGTPLMWTLPDVPVWALVRDGAAISRNNYPYLFAVLCPARTGVTTSASASVTGLSSTADLWVGMPVEGNGIPAGTTIASIDSASSITLSAAATASASVPITLFYYGYGAGGNASTFGVPDDRGVFERGLDTGAAGRDTLSYSCTNTGGTSSITGLSGTDGMSVGMAVSGTGVPGGATIAAINSATSITLSANTTTAVSNINVTGNRIGAYSVDQLASHRHARPLDGPSYAGAVTSVVGYYPGNYTSYTAYTGNNETKPKNRAYLPIIVY